MSNADLETKLCRTCGETKPLAAYYRVTRGRLGRGTECRLCAGQRYRAYYANNSEKNKARARAWRKANPEKDRLKVARWRAANPEKYRAAIDRWESVRPEAKRLMARVHQAVCVARKSGRIIKPSACEECGATGCQIDAAHRDYSRPLDVRWLCRPCHSRWDHAEPKLSREVG